jgi:CheY-like chemotaxis protein
VAGKRILLIDHRPEHMRQPVLRLELEGYDVDEAPSAEEGLRKLREDGYDLVLLDAELPETNGWAALKEIREDPRLSDLRVIVFMAGQGEPRVVPRRCRAEATLPDRRAAGQGPAGVGALAARRNGRTRKGPLPEAAGC